MPARGRGFEAIIRRKQRGCFRMSMLGMSAALVGAVLALTAANAWAGPCTSDIAAFEVAIARSKGDPLAGLTAPQSVGAQLSHEPTPASVKKAQDKLKSRF